jgi:dipeptidyl aminopeptidase/acylaminoacyl peptidase
VVFSESYPIGNIGVGTRTELVRPNGDAIALDTPPSEDDPDSEASISADGSKVAFLRGGDNSNPATIYVVNADGSALSVAAPWSGAYLSAPAISPDGRAIAYWCVSPYRSDPVSTPPPRKCGPLPDGSYRRSGLMLMNADGSDKRMIVIGSGAGTPAPLSWSPDGRWLTTDGCSVSPCTSQVFVYRTDGSDLFNYLDPSREVNRRQAAQEKVTNADAPQFCGGSSQILYESGRHAYLINRNGTHRERTAISPPYGYSPPFPPPFENGTPPAGHPVCVPPAEGGGPLPTVNVMRVTVPGVRTLSYASARQRLHRAGFHVGSLQHAFSTTIRRGHVIAQYPRAGVHAHRTDKEGPPVKLVLSRGPHP